NSGNFILSASVGEVIVFSSLGYQSRELVVGGGNNYSIQLQPADESLNAVVVVGYGVQKRGDVTGSISSVSGKALKEVPVTNVTQMLQGRAAGVSVVSAGNKPGA